MKKHFFIYIYSSIPIFPCSIGVQNKVRLPYCNELVLDEEEGDLVVLNKKKTYSTTKPEVGLSFVSYPKTMGQERIY